jgi:mRNA interferase RelE/StbE
MTVVWTHPAERELAGLDRTQGARVVEAIVRFATTGYGDVKALKGSTEKRLRVGDYRVLFDSDGSTMTVLRVAHRREAYR